MENDHIRQLREYAMSLEDSILEAKKLMSSEFNDYWMEKVYRAKFLAYTAARDELYGRFPEVREAMERRVPETVSED